MNLVQRGQLTGRRPPGNRKGYSLIEAISMIFILGSLMSFAAVAVHQSTLTQKTALSCIRHTKLLDDLHSRLLLDTTAASQLKKDNDVIQLLSHDGRSTEYALASGSIIRTAKSATNEIVGQSRWNISARQMKVELDQSQPIALATYNLQVDQLPSTADFAVQRANSASAVNSNGATVDDAISPAMFRIRWVSRMGVEQ